MKLLFVVCCVIAVIGIALFVGCSSDESGTDTCMSCHSETTTEGEQILSAQAGYDNSGHWNGPRMLVPMEVLNATGHLYAFHGSNAAYANTCAPCHTHEQFVEYVATGTEIDDMTPAPIGCFTCHAPHEQGDFGLITAAPVTLVVTTPATTTFDGGDGNLCVACHLARDEATDDIDPTDYTDKGVGGQWATVATDFIGRFGPHHGPQGDYLMGVNNAISPTLSAPSPHADTTELPDTCVTCHHFQTEDRLGGSLEWGGHGFYLTADVHGAGKDLIDVCNSCHEHADATFEDDATGDPDTAEGFLYMDVLAPNWAGDGAGDRVFEEIQTMRDELIEYFGDSVNFIRRHTPVWDPVDEEFDYSYAAGASNDGIGAIVSANSATLDFDTGGSYEWGQGWVFNDAEMNVAQSEALWNFKLFIEDKSGGVHNHLFAAKLLWDAINTLNAATPAPNGGAIPIGTDPIP